MNQVFSAKRFNSYSKSEIVDGKFIRTQITETLEFELPIEEDNFFITVTHIGAYGRIKFIAEGEEWETTGSGSQETIALNEDNTRAVAFKPLKKEYFDQLWSKYTSIPSKECPYWLPV